MKLHLLYTYFDGFEQLKHSIDSMIDHVDHVTVCFQMISNSGEFRLKVLNEIEKLERLYPDIRTISFTPDLSVDAHTNERAKHNQMIQHAKKQGATHFILSACDHVYKKAAFDYAKSFDCDVCLTSMYTYYKNDNWRLDPIEEYYMPFIHKMYSHTEITEHVNYPVLVDPCVKVNTSENIIVFKPDECILHHYSMIRNDIELKFRNSAAKTNWTSDQVETFINEYNNAKLGDSITYYGGRKLVES